MQLATPSKEGFQSENTVVSQRSDRSEQSEMLIMVSWVIKPN